MSAYLIISFLYTVTVCCMLTKLNYSDSDSDSEGHQDASEYICI